MIIDVVNYSEYIPQSKVSGATVIVIDVLRCTSCIITALNNGADSVIVFAGVEEARSYAQKLGRKNCVLGGERHALPIDGYDVGNSPLQYNRARVAGKTVIMSTTNGARAISGIKGSAATLIAASINHLAAANEAALLGNNVLIVCSGTNGEVSADDIISAGAIVSDLTRIVPNLHTAPDSCTAPDSRIIPDIRITDAARISMLAYTLAERGELNIKETDHGKYLMGLGESFIADIDYCFRESIIDYVPRCIGMTDDNLGAIIR